MSSKSQPIVVPAPGGIVVAPLVQAKKHKRKFDAVLTIEDPNAKPADRLRFSNETTTKHMVLKFEDVDSERFGYATASRDQVREAIEFGREHADGTLLVHCMHGVGRSAACALAIIADRMGPGRETEAVTELIAMRPDATPNLIVVYHADDILGSGGALKAAVTAFEASTPEKTEMRTERDAFAQDNADLYAPASHPGKRSLRNPSDSGFRIQPRRSMGKGPEQSMPDAPMRMPKARSAGR